MSGRVVEYSVRENGVLVGEEDGEGRARLQGRALIKRKVRELCLEHQLGSKHGRVSSRGPSLLATAVVTSGWTERIETSGAAVEPSIATTPDKSYTIPARKLESLHA